MNLIAVCVIPDELANSIGLGVSERVVFEKFEIVIFEANGSAVFCLVLKEHDEVFEGAGFSGDEFFVEVAADDAIDEGEESVGIRESLQARERAFFMESPLLPLLSFGEFKVLLLFVVFDEICGKCHGGVGYC